MWWKRLAAIDDAADLVDRKRAAMSTREASEIGHHDLEARGNRTVAQALVTVARRAEPRVELLARVLREVLRPGRDGRDEQQDQNDDRRDRDVTRVNLHERLRTSARTATETG